MGLELKRKEKLGLLKAMKLEKKQWRGKLPEPKDYIGNALLGFVFGWKFLYLFSNGKEFFSDPQSHILSLEGSLVLGLLGAAFGVGIKYYETLKTKKQYPEPVEVDVIIRPHQRMGTMTLIAAGAGLLGAKIFDHMENWDQFIQNPLGAFLDPFSGLTFYGGLICGGAAVLWYARKVGINWRHMLDVGGPAMMLAYGVGRIGCHMSGDGDWGIVNNSPKPGFLPDWLWGYTYPNNVAGICDPITQAKCPPGTFPELSMPVWPTPIYESIMCIALFAVLWYLRKRISVPGVLFSIYLFMAGFERFWIEKIRVNDVYHIAGMKITQAEIISAGLMIAGIAMFFWFRKNPTVKEPPVVRQGSEVSAD